MDADEFPSPSVPSSTLRRESTEQNTECPSLSPGAVSVDAAVSTRLKIVRFPCGELVPSSLLRSSRLRREVLN
jgi:hypothetical protein